jgi:hypothetical protein
MRRCRKAQREAAAILADAAAFRDPSKVSKHARETAPTENKGQIGADQTSSAATGAGGMVQCQQAENGTGNGPSALAPGR